MTGSLAAEAGLRWLLVGGLILAVGARPWFLAIATAFVLALATFVLQPPAEFRERSFFGVTEVLHPADGDLRILMNGTTVHGTQSTDPARRRIPLSYYSTRGPAGDIFRVADAADPAPVVGVLGLGGGALATYERPGTPMTFFEIDPVVVKVASDPRYFTYLTDAPTPPRIVVGDARLSLQQEPDARYDLLVLDAFSSDSVPVHLLTVEAIADELRTRDPGRRSWRSTSRIGTTTSRRRSPRRSPAKGSRSSSARTTPRRPANRAGPRRGGSPPREIRRRSRRWWRPAGVRWRPPTIPSRMTTPTFCGTSRSGV